jgi:hypothetical protein
MSPGHPPVRMLVFAALTAVLSLMFGACASQPAPPQCKSCTPPAECVVSSGIMNAVAACYTRCKVDLDCPSEECCLGGNGWVVDDGPNNVCVPRSAGTCTPQLESSEPGARPTSLSSRDEGME